MKCQILFFVKKYFKMSAEHFEKQEGHDGPVSLTWEPDIEMIKTNILTS